MGDEWLAQHRVHLTPNYDASGTKFRRLFVPLSSSKGEERVLRPPVLLGRRRLSIASPYAAGTAAGVMNENRKPPKPRRPPISRSSRQGGLLIIHPQDHALTANDPDYLDLG